MFKIVAVVSMALGLTLGADIGHRLRRKPPTGITADESGVPSPPCQLTWAGNANVDYLPGLKTVDGWVYSDATFGFTGFCSKGLAGSLNQCFPTCYGVSWFKWNVDTHSWDEARQKFYNGGPYQCGGTYQFTERFWGIEEMYGAGHWQMLCIVFLGDKSAPGIPLAGWQRFFVVD